LRASSVAFSCFAKSFLADSSVECAVSAARIAFSNFSWRDSLQPATASASATAAAAFFHQIGRIGISFAVYSSDSRNRAITL
jgi:hypothetical protein